ncbi:hypothetical protein [Paenibacillus qinlingensis]|uniref:hypothetical protein n=1 Tax=Paenibacillus qinlingensis TaxID=1837343 RepID=UPI001565BDEA|nr:hypothetical protein [Paenibacillus qinlingensis]NQX62675.1 hypothetical protein [Paenibacillus qinlingensis]
MQNLQICGLGFIVLCIMYYLVIDVFEKSKRLRQTASNLQEPLTAAIPPITIKVVPPIQEGVYPMYIDCSRSEQFIPPHSNNALTPVTI